MRRILVLAAVLTLGFAPAPLPKKSARAEGPNLQGEWEVVSWGKQLREGGGLARVTAAMTVRIGSGRLEIALHGSPLYDWSLTFHPTARPASVDLLDSRNNATLLAIYRLEGDVLTICYRGPGEDRPTDFNGQMQWQLVLKRK